MRAQLVNNLAKCDLAIVIRINDLEKVLYLSICVAYTNVLDQVSEFMFIKNSIVVAVNLLKQHSKFLQKFLMLSKLKVQNWFQEFSEQYLFIRN